MSSQVSEICTHKKWKQWREQDELHCSFFLMLPQLPREKGRWNWIAEHILANKATEQKSRAAAAGTRPHQNITTLANNGKKEVREHKSGVKTSKVGRGCVWWVWYWEAHSGSDCGQNRIKSFRAPWFLASLMDLIWTNALSGICRALLVLVSGFSVLCCPPPCLNPDCPHGFHLRLNGSCVFKPTCLVPPCHTGRCNSGYVVDLGCVWVKFFWVETWFWALFLIRPPVWSFRTNPN